MNTASPCRLRIEGGGASEVTGSEVTDFGTGFGYAFFRAFGEIFVYIERIDYCTLQILERDCFIFFIFLLRCYLSLVGGVLPSVLRGPYCPPRFRAKFSPPRYPAYKRFGKFIRYNVANVMVIFYKRNAFSTVHELQKFRLRLYWFSPAAGAELLRGDWPLDRCSRPMRKS